jgi:hypothetical protein
MRLSASQTTVGELAGHLGTTTQALAGSLGKTVEQLPATAMALTAPLTNGKALGALNGLGGITLSLLNGSKGGGSEGGPGGPGGSGSQGSGGSGTSGATTVIVSTPLAQTAGQLAASRSARKVGKLKIINHRVKGRIATIVVQVPAAGKLALRGGGVKTVSRETSRSERITLRAILSRAGVSSLRKHHRLRVKLTISFRPSSGPSSSATVTVTFS